MNIAQLVKMANQIGGYFATYPDQALARQEIAGHLQRFWNPRMRAALRQHVAGCEHSGLSPLVAAAVHELDDPLVATSPPR